MTTACWSQRPIAGTDRPSRRWRDGRLGIRRQDSSTTRRVTRTTTIRSKASSGCATRRRRSRATPRQALRARASLSSATGRRLERIRGGIAPASHLAPILEASVANRRPFVTPRPTGGIHHWAKVGGQPDLPLKTSPSGGSRHPIEIYVWARRVAGLPAGLYHYACDRHQLELVRRQRSRVSAQRYLPTQFLNQSAPAIVFFSAVYERYQWKYGDPRAYRATLIEVGHQCQTFCLAATSLGLAPFCAMALADSEIESDLGLDGVSELCALRGRRRSESRPAAPSAPCRRGCRRPAFASTIGSFGTTHDHSVRTRRLRSHAADRGLRRVERAHQQHDAGRALDAWRRHEQDKRTRSRRSRPRRLPDNNKRFRQPSASMLRLPSPLLRSW